MKLILIKLILVLILCSKSIFASILVSEYTVSTSGIKIGKFSWSLLINENSYETKILLENSGFFSPLYKFKGEYKSTGIIVDSELQVKYYKQFWQTKKKIKIVEMVFDKKLKELIQDPVEEEYSRIDLDSLYMYFDPITSFINILNGNKKAKTIDGRRTYIMEAKSQKNSNKIVIEIENYKNIWADHKRNDLKKIEFLIGDKKLLPEKISVYFKDRVFSLKKN